MGSGIPKLAVTGSLQTCNVSECSTKFTGETLILPIGNYHCHSMVDDLGSCVRRDFSEVQQTYER